MKSLTIVIPACLRLLKILGLKLGNLNQHSPRPLTPSDLPNTETPTNKSKISIITPSFEQGKYIEKTLQSVLHQDYPNLEYYVQDGGSKDNTLAIIKKYSDRLSGWESTPDNGQSNAINLAFHRTTGDIMAWLNSDDLLLPGSLNYIANYFNNHPEVDVVYGNRLLIDENNMEIGRWILPGHYANVLSWADYIPQETLFWRRRIWDKIGGRIDESFRFAMDWDLLLRFRNSGAVFSHLPYFIGAFRVHGAQKTSSLMSSQGLDEMNRIRERELGKVPSRPARAKAALPFIIGHLIAENVFRLKVKLKKSGKKNKPGVSNITV